MSNDNANNSSDKIKKLFQEQLDKQKTHEHKTQKKELAESDAKVWLTIIVSILFYTARVSFIYLGYFLLHKNLGFELHFNFLDFFLIAFAITNFIGIIKNALKK